MPQNHVNYNENFVHSNLNEVKSGNLIDLEDILGSNSTTPPCQLNHNIISNALEVINPQCSNPLNQEGINNSIYFDLDCKYTFYA